MHWRGSGRQTVRAAVLVSLVRLKARSAFFWDVRVALAFQRARLRAVVDQFPERLCEHTRWQSVRESRKKEKVFHVHSCDAGNGTRKRKPRGYTSQRVVLILPAIPTCLSLRPVFLPRRWDTAGCPMSNLGCPSTAERCDHCVSHCRPSLPT